MPKHFYFIISSHLISCQPYILRLVAQRDSDDELMDHYFEYGCARNDDLVLDGRLWSTDPDALLDAMPKAAQFHASMDIRLFLRNDLADALDGSLMADDVEIVLRQHQGQSGRAASGRVYM